MLVIRTDKKGNLKNSKPCSHCLETLKLFGVRTVYFSTDEGSIEKHKITSLVTDHFSGGQKKYYRLLGKSGSNKLDPCTNKSDILKSYTET